MAYSPVIMEASHWICLSTREEGLISMIHVLTRDNYWLEMSILVIFHACKIPFGGDQWNLLMVRCFVNHVYYTHKFFCEGTLTVVDLERNSSENMQTHLKEVLSLRYTPFILHSKPTWKRSRMDPKHTWIRSKMNQKSINGPNKHETGPILDPKHTWKMD